MSTCVGFGCVALSKSTRNNLTADSFYLSILHSTSRILRNVQGHSHEGLLRDAGGSQSLNKALFLWGGRWDWGVPLVFHDMGSSLAAHKFLKN